MTCETCKHWHQLTGPATIGICGEVRVNTELEHYAGVFWGAHGGTALTTPHDFGCNQHEPVSPGKEAAPIPPWSNETATNPIGWICYRCQRANAPHVNQCPCTNEVK
jgi:hypothetical protein